MMADPSQYITTATILTLVAVTGLAGNGLTIISVFLSTKLQTKTNVFVVNLAVGDVITCTGILVQLVALLSRREPFIPASFGDLIAILGSVSMSSTILTLAMIGIIRCARATRSPIIFDGFFSTLKLTLMIFLTWAIPVSSNVLYYLGGGRNLYDSQIKMYKFALLENTGFDIPVAIFFVIDATLVIVCTLVMLICYLKIVLHVRAHTRRISVELGGVSPSSQALQTGNRAEPPSGHQAENSQQRSGRPARHPLRLEVDLVRAREVAITKILALVTIVFLVCFLPFIILSINPNPFNSNPYIFNIVFVLLLSNSAMNPIIYALTHAEFRKVYRCILTGSLREIPSPSRSLRAALQ